MAENSPSLTPDQVQIWLTRIVRAYRVQRPHRLRWEKILDYYKGNYYTSFEDHDRVSANWVLAAVRQTIAALYSRDPSMNFEPQKEKAWLDAQIMEKMIPYVRRLIHLPKEERMALQNAILFGTGITKYAWNAEFDMDSPLAGKEVSERGSGPVSPTGPDVSGEDVILPQGVFTEHNTRIVRGQPWGKSINPVDFLVDPDALTYHEARWVCHRFVRPWIDAKRDIRWRKSARDILEATGTVGFLDPEQEMFTRDWQDHPDQVDTAMVTFYEIFDKTTQRIIVLCSSCEEDLVNKPYPFFGKDGPYEILQFFPTPDTFWAIPHAGVYTPQVEAMNKMRSQMMDHVQRTGTHKFAYQKGSIDNDDLKKFLEAKSDSAVELEMQGTDDINKVLKAFEYVPITADAWNLTQLFMSDFEKISGQSENALGGGAGVQTATEANAIQQQLGLRTEDMRGEFDNFIRGSVRKVVAIMRKMFTGEQVVRIVGPDGQAWDAIVNSLVVNGEYDVDIEPGSTQRVDRNAQMRQAIELLQVLRDYAPLVAQQGVMLNLPEMLKEVLRNSDLVKNPDRFIQVIPQQPQPQQLPGPQGFANPEAPQVPNQFDRLVETQDPFVNGRQLSEAAGGVI